MLEWKFPDWAAVTGPAINILKGAILAADRVMTVSQVHSLHLLVAVLCLRHANSCKVIWECSSRLVCQYMAGSHSSIEANEAWLLTDRTYRLQAHV